MAKITGSLNRRSACPVALLLLLVNCGVVDATVPDWLFLPCVPKPMQPTAAHPVGLAGSKQQFLSTLVAARTSAIDWFPDSHESMPALLAEPRKAGQTACGYCHLPDGAGRPENAKLAGLPQSYIIGQLEQMHAGERDSAQHGYLPLVLMRQSLEGFTAQERQAAAAYYSRQKPRSYERVIETEQVPAFTAGCFVMVRAKGKSQLIAERIVELADHPDEFELRDPRTTYTAYVPRGSLSRGAALASRGSESLASCTSCHGEGLRGGAKLPGPPLAGRFAGYLARQLYGFKSGARHGTAAEPMQAVAALLSDRDVIDVAAYAAALRP